MIADHIIAGVPFAATTITVLLTGMVASLDAVRWFLEEFKNRSAKKKKKKKKKPQTTRERLNIRDMNDHSILLSNKKIYHLAKNAKTLARHGVRHHTPGLLTSQIEADRLQNGP